MPYPYAYYKEEYNGPLHGTELKSPLLIINSPSVEATGGEVDVAGRSHVFLDTTAGSIQIDNFTNAKDGQVLFIYKNNAANSVTIKYATPLSEGKVFTANKQDIVWGPGFYGGAILICKHNGSAINFYHMDSNGLFAPGTELLPGIGFASDSDTGIWNKAANLMAFSTAGIERLAIGTSSISSQLPIRFPDGSVTIPGISFNSDTDTGFYKEGTKIGISFDAISTLAFTKDNHIQSSSSVSFTSLDDVSLMPVRAGTLMISNASDDALVPPNGIYSKGNVRTGGQFIGTATSSLYADLAERYEADAEYPAGTIVKIGGEKEITAATQYNAFAVISSAPGFKMNSEAGNDKTHPYVALAGRVPCRVWGYVKKGDPITVSSLCPGVGEAGFDGPIIGRALEDKEGFNEGLVMIVTRALI